MQITGKKLHTLIIIVVILIIEYFCVSAALPSSNINSMDIDTALRMISAVSAISFIIELILWKRISNELISPFIVFFITLYFFCCGQSLGWIFGIKMGERDLWYRTTYGTTHEVLLKGMCYSMIGITCFFLGAVLQTKLDQQHTDKKRNQFAYEDIISAYQNVGKIMLFICVPAFVANTFQTLMIVSTNGYLGIYANAYNSSPLARILSIIADYYQPCMLILLLGYKDNPGKRRLILVAMLLDVISALYMGGRSGAFMCVLGILVAYHYFIHQFQKKEVFGMGVTGYLAMAISNGISLNRAESGRSVFDIFTGIFSAHNVITEFIGELGWNLSSICWTMNLVPQYYPFRYGMSYLVSLLTFIPSTFFPNGHPIVKWANIGDWLQAALNQTSGPGYTMIAESYINFGWFGFIALVIEGYIVSRFIACVPRNKVKENMLSATFQIIIIMTIMKSLVRASVSASARTILFVILPLYILLRMSIKNTTTTTSEKAQK